MKPKLQHLFLCLSGTVLSFYVQAQIIFSYGNHEVKKDEFLYAYLKNAEPGNHSSGKVNDYLKLYSVYKMKTAEAKRLGYDTLERLQQDLENFKMQITPGFLINEEFINKAVEYADRNSRKEIKLGIVEFGNTSESEKQAWRMYDELNNGGDFQTLALKYSTDPAVKKHKGVAGYITAFILPYHLEKIIFDLPAGKYSRPVATESGWYVFANLEERPASGTITISQIFFSFPPEASPADKQKTASLADSVYNLLMQGADFEELAVNFSDDIHSASSGGLMQPFTTGEYSDDFTEKAFSLKQDGEIGKPFQTEFGYHIIRRMQLSPIPPKGDKEYESNLRSRVMNDEERMKEARKATVEALVDKLGYKEMAEREKLLEAAKTGNHNCNGQNAIIEFANGDIVSCDEWKQYIDQRFNPQEKNPDYPWEFFEYFKEEMILRQYEKELPEHNKDYALLLDEFREGNLLFEIMQNEVWEKAVADSAGQMEFFRSRSAAYKWKDGAEMIIFSAYDSSIAWKFMDELKKNPREWRYIPYITEGYIIADSGRMEYAHIPFENASSIAEGQFTDMQKNEFDGSYSFAYIIKKVPGGDEKDFESARGFVMLDYQKYLEEKWVNELKQRYPLKINKKELNRLIKELKNGKYNKG